MTRLWQRTKHVQDSTVLSHAEQGARHRAQCGRTRLIGWLTAAVLAGLPGLLLLLWLEALPEPAAKPLREAIMFFKDPVEKSFQVLDLRSAERIAGIVVPGG